MNSLERTTILKCGYDHGWEAVVEDTPTHIVLASALHRARMNIVQANPKGTGWYITLPSGNLEAELAKTTSRSPDTGQFQAANEASLCFLMAHAARLARSLPDEPHVRFEKAVSNELATVPSNFARTEIERLVRQRVGQDIYRESLLDYWGGACAVTGIAVPGLLRASHAKPWAECANDNERLNVFNGFLLTAHLDALFDRHLMTFSTTGEALFAKEITPSILASLGLKRPVNLRWLRDDHEVFLAYHRAAFRYQNNR